MGHTDVVAVEADKWTQNPFGGDIVDGFIYGRGALDMKNMVAMELMVMLLLKRLGVALKRDVIFMAAADEEVDSLGAHWVATKHPELIGDAEFAINEGGGNAREINGRMYYHIQTAEKGVQRFRLRTRGKPGHGATPHDDNAIAKLGRLLAKLQAARLPVHVSATARAYVEGLAAGQPEPLRSQLLALLEPSRCYDAIAALPLSESFKRQLHANLRNTVAPTMLSAGTQANVIPSAAEATCDARIVPGQTRESLRRELQDLFGGQGASDFEIEFIHPTGSVALEAQPAGELWDTIVSVLAERAPGCGVVPKMLAGATDAKAVAPLGIQVYGFAPELYTGPDEGSRVHGHDERVSVDSMRWGVWTLFQTVRRFCGR
jgi:acetylornithine deacetylase/succinyl-diaminopimelate desuccinylase-like protein